MEYQQAAKVFKALAQPERLRILHVLADGGTYVCDLVEATGRAQPCVSQHLKVLRAAGLVIDRKEGFHVSYQIRDARLAGVLDLAAAIAGGPAAIDVSPDIWTRESCPACRERRRRDLEEEMST